MRTTVTRKVCVSAEEIMKLVSEAVVASLKQAKLVEGTPETKVELLAYRGEADDYATVEGAVVEIVYEEQAL